MGFINVESRVTYEVCCCIQDKLCSILFLHPGYRSPRLPGDGGEWAGWGHVRQHSTDAGTVQGKIQSPHSIVVLFVFVISLLH